MFQRTKIVGIFAPSVFGRMTRSLLLIAHHRARRIRRRDERLVKNHSYREVMASDKWEVVLGKIKLFGNIRACARGSANELTRKKKTTNWMIAITVAVLYLMISVISHKWEIT